MRGRIAFSIFGVLALAGLALVWSFGCDEKPTDPGEGGPKDYVLYWNRYGDDSAFFGYHTLTGQIDSFFLPSALIYDMKASADGELLYISYRYKISVVRTRDFKLVADLPYSGFLGVAVSPDNRHIAVQGSNLRILSTTDFSVVFQDTIGVYRSVFSANGLRLYAPGPESSCPSVYRLDLEHGFRSKITCFPDPYPIRQVAPSRDEKLLFMFRYLGSCYMLFDVFDRCGDSLVFRDLVAPGCGDMVVSHDNRFVYFTGPGDKHGWPPPAYTFARYGIRDKTVDSLLFWSVCGYDFPTGIIGHYLTLTPDDRFLAINEPYPHVRVLVFNCQSEDTAKTLCIPGMEFWHLTCQNGT